MKIHTFGLATVAALLISQLSAPLPSSNTATSSYTLDQTTFKLTQTNSMLAFKLEEKDPLATDKILIEGTELAPDENGLYEYDMKQQLEVEVVLSSDSAGSLDAANPMRQIATRSFPIRNIGLSDAAVAQSTNATRTRIRYQTFIGAPLAYAMPGCEGDYPNLGFTFFNGNNRSWDANSESYKTRFDTIIAWGTNPSVTKEVSVGATTAYIHVFPLMMIPVATETASSQSMKLTTSVVSPTYVSYKISQRVVNPFCSNVDGIRFSLNFYVRRDGVYTMTGNYLPVPHHEIYARDNFDPSWRQLLREGGDNFPCLLPILSPSCDIDIEQRAAF
jgi:hypothetical protein